MSEREDDKLLKIITNFKASVCDRIRELIVEFDIKTPRDFIYVPSNRLKGMKNFGELNFLEFKKLLIVEFGVQYDNDSIVDIDRKIRERPVVKNDALLKLRFKILQRDGFRCQYCGRNPQTCPEVELQIDHIHPGAHGGQFIEENLITSCRECNLGKSDALLKKREEKDR